MKMKRNKIIFLVIIFLIIVSKINYVFADSVQAIDVLKVESYDTFSSMLGSYSIEAVTGQLTDENFSSFYDFVLHGVDVDRVKECKQETAYENLIMTVLEKMENIQKAQTQGPAGGGGGSDIKKDLENLGYNLRDEKENASNLLNQIGASGDNKKRAAEIYDSIENLDEASKSTDIQKRVDAVAEATKKHDESNAKIYQQPTVATNKTSGSTLDDMMTDADNFVQAGENDKIKASDLQRLSRLIYNIALQIGIGVAVIAGLALGIQFMMSSVEGKADVKKGLKIYVIGCVVVFGSFGIWKLIVTIMQQI